MKKKTDGFGGLGSIKHQSEVIIDFLNNLGREGMDSPVAIILTPKAFARALAEAGFVGAKAFEMAGPNGHVVIQAGIVQREGE